MLEAKTPVTMIPESLCSIMHRVFQHQGKWHLSKTTNARLYVQIPSWSSFGVSTTGKHIFSPSHRCPHQHSPSSLIIQEPVPQQRGSSTILFSVSLNCRSYNTVDNQSLSFEVSNSIWKFTHGFCFCFCL